MGGREGEVKPGTLIRLADGREGTVVYHGPDGYGIKWGHMAVEVAGSGCEVLGVREEVPEGYDCFPDAMLRDPYHLCELECVGTDYEIVGES